MTTDQVAKMLEVNKSTVKRWSDSGKIRCIRTLGHHRKFNYDDVMEFIMKNNLRSGQYSQYNERLEETVIIREMVRRKELNMFRSVISTAALHGNKAVIVDLFLSLSRVNLSFQSMIVDIVLPVFQKFDRTLEQGRLDPQRRIVARTTLSQAFTAFSSRIERAKRRSSLIIIYSFEHSMETELRILELKLEIDGYLTVNLGIVRSWTMLEQWIGKSGTDMMLCLLKQAHNRNGNGSDFAALDRIAESRGMVFICGTMSHLVDMDPDQLSRQFRHPYEELISNDE